ncbi:MAG: RIP metalloprotease RseP [Bacillota bacterium]|nr:RIP metalloprotease RseP [Bacillota bacterium]
MLTAIAAIAVFCLLILSHEFGHFIVAKWSGVYVEDFSLGMGPKLLQWQGKETTYTLRPFPIGGWCKMRGEDEDSDDPRAFNNAKIWKRILTVFAGPLMNFVIAIVLFIIIFMMLGTASSENVAGKIQPGQPAEAAGMQAGDRILSVNGIEIATWEQIGPAVNSLPPGSELSVLVERDGQQLILSITPVFNEEYQLWMLGIEAERLRQNLFTAIALGCKQSIWFVKELILALISMFTGQAPVDVAGPVGIVTIIGDSARYGLQSLLLLTAYLSINLGLLNLFPLPALDGSRIIFLAIEGLRGRPIDRRKEGMVHFVGLMALMALMTYNDILRLIAS